MIENGELCFKCQKKQMPPWSRMDTARACQGCLAVEAKDKCQIKSCNKIPAIMVQFEGCQLEVCIQHSRLDLRQVRQMMEIGEI